MDFTSHNHILDRCFAPSTDEEIAYLEKEIGYPLPEDYREFLQQVNGGFIPGGVYFRAPGQATNVTTLYGFAFQDDGSNILLALDAYEFKERVPPFYIPIADAQMFYRVTLCLSGPATGAIFDWRPMEEWEAVPCPTEKHLKQIAPSFTAFWCGLDWANYG